MKKIYFVALLVLLAGCDKTPDFTPEAAKKTLNQAQTFVNDAVEATTENVKDMIESANGVKAADELEKGIETLQKK